MRLNTTRSIQLARHVKGRFGTWQQVREAARLENGVYVLDDRAASPDPAPALLVRR